LVLSSSLYLSGDFYNISYFLSTLQVFFLKSFLRCFLKDLKPPVGGVLSKKEARINLPHNN
ncbi:MAG: hypothetical protein ACQEXX_26345, partial [Bacillota bacterium]